MKLLFVSLIVALGVGCGDTIIHNELPTTPTETAPKVVSTTIEFRVTGNLSLVRVRYSDTIDGIEQTVTGLPYFFSFSTTKDTMFVSLDVTPVTLNSIVENPFLTAKILINGELFREGSSTDLLTSLVVNGQWRR